MHAVIVGAGISGLATAVALHRQGLKVTVIERSPALTEVGAGVVMGANAMRSLDFIGGADYVRTVNEPPETFIHSDMVSGEVREVSALGDARRVPVRAYTTHRRDLIDSLAQGLHTEDLRLAQNLVELHQDEHGVTVTLGDGGTIRADLLVGADGLRSTVRTAVFGPTPAIFSGFLAWRTVRPMEVLGRPLAERTTRLWTGAGRHIVCYPIRKGTQFYAAFYVPADEVHREDWTVSGDIAGLRTSFADVCPDVRSLTEDIDEAFITGIYYRDPLPTWHRGRVVLLGDAAHPVLPTSGQGAAMAVEDAVAIAGCLRRHGTDVGSAFAEFEARRKPRTTRLLYSSRADLTAYQESDPVKIAARGQMTAGIRQLDPTGHQRVGWLHSYDEPAESAKSSEQFSDSAGLPPARPAARRAYAAWRGAMTYADSIDGWLTERAAYARFLSDIDGPPDAIEIEPTTCGAVSALRVTPPGGENGPAVLHLHGGGFVYGSAAGAVGLAARIADAVGGWALVPDYRLAPEHDAEAMGSDVRDAYDWLCGRAGRIVVTGECAGGGLAVGLIAGLRDDGRPLPDAAYLLSPFLDMTLEGASIAANAAREPWLTRERLLQLAGSYVQTHRPDDPLVSPARGSLALFPPLRIFAASDEALVDDARRLQSAAEQARVDTRLTLVDDSVHSFALFAGLPESQQVLDEIRLHVVALGSEAEAERPRRQAATRDGSTAASAPE